MSARSVKRAPLKPTKNRIAVADAFIRMLQAYKLGKPIQKSGIESDNKWYDCDLWDFMNPRLCKKYRIKTVKTKGKKI